MVARPIDLIGPGWVERTWVASDGFPVVALALQGPTGRWHPCYAAGGRQADVGADLPEPSIEWATWREALAVADAFAEGLVVGREAALSGRS